MSMISQDAARRIIGSLDEWFVGAPPSIGWWPASYSRAPDSIRFWNGEWWSVGARPSFTSQEAADTAGKEALGQDFVEWTHRPKNWPSWSLT